MTEILSDRLARLDKIMLLKGAHTPPDDDGKINGCAMEVASWLTGEPWSDHPECVCPVIGAFTRAWNDGMPDDDDRNTILKPLLLRLIGTRGSVALAERRAMMAADWLVRVHAPAWLRRAKLDAHAEALESLPEITSVEQAQAPSTMEPITAAQRDAVAAWNPARDTAWAAAWAAEGDGAEPLSTQQQLQDSALALLVRMIEATEPKETTK